LSVLLSFLFLSFIHRKRNYYLRNFSWNEKGPVEMKQQNKLTAFLCTASANSLENDASNSRSLQGGAADSSLNSSALLTKRKSKTEEEVKNGVEQGHSSSAVPCTKSIELHLPSPKRAKKTATPRRRAAEEKSASVEDIEEFDSPPPPQPRENEEEAAEVAEEQAKRGSTSPMHPIFARGGRHQRLGKAFYESECERLAKTLLGQVLVRLTSDNQRSAFP